MAREIVNITNNKWKVVLIKTIEYIEPIYYRLANLDTLETIDVPAYRILDEIINNKRDIVNIECNNNKIVIVNEDGYVDNSEVIVIDDFDEEIPNIYDWTMDNKDIGTKIISRFSDEKNLLSPSNSKISSRKRLYWTCDKGHTIRAGFATYFSTGCKCPICELQKQGKAMSLQYWSTITHNEQIVDMYNASDKNSYCSNNIAWNSSRKVWFKRNDEEVQVSLSDITVKKLEIPFSKNNSAKINLTRR